MKKFAALTLSIFFTCGTALAETPKDADPQPAKAAKAAKAANAKAPKSAEKDSAAFAAELEELRQTLQAQQEQLQLLKEELAKRDRQIDAAQNAAAAANSRAIEATSKAAEAVSASAEVKSAETSLNSTVSDLKASNDSLRTTVATSAAQEKKDEESGPASIKYKGVTITPGGWIEAATVTRTRAVSGDIQTPFNSIPFPGNSLSKVTENNFTARQSRATLLVEGKIGSYKASAYYEADFLGTGVTSNNRQSNSYVFRQRQVWGQIATDSGWTVTGGQMWTLATEDRKGIQNRQEALPMMIDPGYVVGFTWARQYGFRVVKDFGGKVAVGLSAEGPQATFGGRGFSTLTTALANGSTSATTLTTSTNYFINAPGSGGGLFNFVDTSNYSVNKAPDIIAKVAFDPGFGHYEVLGILSVFRNRIYPCAVVGTTAGNFPAPATPRVAACPVNGLTTSSAVGAFNSDRVGGGVGASARWSFAKKKVDFGLKAVGGDGTGRYGAAQLADLTFKPDGRMALIRNGQGLGILELHPSPKLDIFFYYGAEYNWRAAYTGYTNITVTRTPAIPATATTAAIPATATTAFSGTVIGGYGSPFANNSGCTSETSPATNITPGTGGTCAGDTRVIQEGTVGFWHKFYQGPKGGLRWGITYSYLTRSGWSGNNVGSGVGTAPGVSPKAVDNMVWTSFRYYIP
jgi:hypothetical protein